MSASKQPISQPRIWRSLHYNNHRRFSLTQEEKLFFQFSTCNEISAQREKEEECRYLSRSLARLFAWAASNPCCLQASKVSAALFHCSFCCKSYLGSDSSTHTALLLSACCRSFSGCSRAAAAATAMQQHKKEVVVSKPSTNLANCKHQPFPCSCFYAHNTLFYAEFKLG